VPHKGDRALFWDRDNWQPLCTSCHNGMKKRIEAGTAPVQIGRDGWPVE
jgi:5-methylcytosine-specific restriction protein A